MRLPAVVERALQQEDFNFFITNQIPRRLLTRFMGWFSRIEQPLVRTVSIGAFELFAGDLHLEEAKKTAFSSLHDCFVRELRDGARPLDPDPDVLVSPCDGFVGAFGAIQGTRLLQVKGSDYSLEDLLGDQVAARRYQDGSYVTLRLTSNMYHRFHAPCACRVEGAKYISGDTWNVNPVTIKRIAQLYCKNERVAIHTRMIGAEHEVTLVAVAAIFVGSIQLSFVDGLLDVSRHVVTPIAADLLFQKGDELGYFHFGSTVIVLGTGGLAVSDHIRTGAVVRVGEALLRHHAVRQTG